ncbi:MBL fold metallo-hydrolase, partial [Candidatus Parcubacteria bacterium]|nr:MBL fold metallo-hydrolase [Candidatus Parcubacteria bacterium]
MGPGEYEVKEVFVKGVPSDSSEKGLRNTIYLLELDKIRLCFLGAVAGKIPAESRAAIEGVDILFVPVSGGALSASDAYQLAVSFEPKVIIPMDYDEGSEAFKKFLKEGGSQKAGTEEKLTVKQKDIEGKEAEIVVLAAQH